MTIAVLAVQGAFSEHERMLQRLGARCVEIRQRADLAQAYDGLVLPGGESTVQGKLLRELGLFEPLRDQIQQDMPVLATCAGMILLAESIEGADGAYFQTIPMTVRRNAYGRQLGSFSMEGEYKGLGVIPMTFIRAPYVTAVKPDVEVLAREGAHMTAVRYKNQTALAFHPELNDDACVHSAFLETVRTHRQEQ